LASNFIRNGVSYARNAHVQALIVLLCLCCPSVLSLYIPVGADTVLIDMNAVITWQLRHWPTHVQQWHLAGGCCVKIQVLLLIALNFTQQFSKCLVHISHPMALFSLPLLFLLALPINLGLQLHPCQVPEM
jgi:hypothetical protein